MKRTLLLVACSVLMVLIFSDLGLAKSYKWRLGTAHTGGIYVELPINLLIMPINTLQARSRSPITQEIFWGTGFTSWSLLQSARKKWPFRGLRPM